LGNCTLRLGGLPHQTADLDHELPCRQYDRRGSKTSESGLEGDGQRDREGPKANVCTEIMR